MSASQDSDQQIVAWLRSLDEGALVGWRPELLANMIERGEYRAALTPSALSGDAGEVQDWQKPYAEAGHDVASVFAHPKYECSRCGAAQIDLSEDLAYGPMRQCQAALPSHQGAE